MTPTSIPTDGWHGIGPEAEPEIVQLDKRIIQERNRHACLKWLRRFGWLTSRMIASLIWADAAQPMAMARRTLKDLVAEKFLLNGKAPDGLVIDSDQGHAAWIEVEHSQKSRIERQKTVALVRQHTGTATYTELSTGLHLTRVVIVSTNPEALRWMAASFEGAVRSGELRFNQAVEVDACLLPISESLVPRERVDENLWWDIVAAAEPVGK